MSTSDFPMLSSDTDISDEEGEMIENRVNEVFTETLGVHDISDDGKKLFNHIRGKKVSTKEIAINSHSVSNMQERSTVNTNQHHSVELVISNENDLEETSNRELKAENFSRNSQQDDVELFVDIKDTNSRSSTCHELNDNKFAVDAKRKTYDNPSMSCTQIEANVTTPIIDIVERGSTSEISVCTSNTESIGSMKKEIFESPIQGTNSSTTSSYKTTKSLDGIGLAPGINLSTPSSSQNTNTQEHVSYSIPDLFPDPSPVLARNQIRSLSQHSVNVLSNNIVSMGSQVHNNSHPAQERFLITVPTDSHYLHPPQFSNNGLHTSHSSHSLPNPTISHPHLKPSPSGRRSIRLRLVEDKDPSMVAKSIFFKKPLLNKNRASSLSMLDENKGTDDEEVMIDLGTVVVSWYEGTTSTELQRHVHTSVCRKLGKTVDDIRLLDEDIFPHEEIVLTPYIPDGSRFMVKFKTRSPTPTKTVYQFASKAPDSPSRAPTPYDSEIDPPSSLDESDSSENDLPQLPFKLKELKRKQRSKKKYIDDDRSSSSPQTSEDDNSASPRMKERDNKKPRSHRKSKDKIKSRKTVVNGTETVEKIIYRKANKTDERKHVIFVLANYFVLFLGCIAISAEIHERGPRWLQWVEENVDRVNACAVDRDSLFECISNGDISGLLASIVLWVARNNTLTIRFFLFGFDSVNKLWTVVYEALVTAICWGTSYMFIRRGLNPDTRANFLEKYWKDAIYGSLAGFNAAFLKAIMKNLIPKEVLEEMVDTNRQLRIVEIFANIFKHHD